MASSDRHQRIPERKKPINGSVLIYYKQRSVEELSFVKEIFEKKNIQYDIITYGAYNQEEYVKKLKEARYVFWLGRHETQGIALEEALSMNVPMIIWDVSNLGHWKPRKKDEELYTADELAYMNTTSAEYFDARCGIKTKKMEGIEPAIEKMEKDWETFSPRHYIVENLGLEKQARELIFLYEKYFGITYSAGQKESLRNNKKWKNDRMQFKIFSWLKATVKKITRKRG